jgi:rfaE bifunctional protein kinase chain/domain
LAAAAESAEAIVVSDYNYGVATPEIFEQARQIAAKYKIPLLIDSRFRLGAFPGATSATPNQEEIEQMLGSAMTDEKCEKVRTDLGLQALLVTCGNKGMRLYESGAAPQFIEAVGSSAAVDVTGAGDTVIAAYALGLASGLSFADAAQIANHAGGIVVMKKGTAAVTVDELNASLSTTPVGAAKAN